MMTYGSGECAALGGIMARIGQGDYSAITLMVPDQVCSCYAYVNVDLQCHSTSCDEQATGMAMPWLYGKNYQELGNYCRTYATCASEGNTDCEEVAEAAVVQARAQTGGDDASSGGDD